MTGIYNKGTYKKNYIIHEYFLNQTRAKQFKSKYIKLNSNIKILNIDFLLILI